MSDIETIFAGVEIARLAATRRLVAAEHRQLREAAGLSQAALGGQIGCDQTQVARNERGEELHRLRAREDALAEALGPRAHFWISELEMLEVEAECQYDLTAADALLAWAAIVKTRGMRGETQARPTLDDAREVGRRVLTARLRRARVSGFAEYVRRLTRKPPADPAAAVASIAREAEQAFAPVELDQVGEVSDADALEMLRIMQNDRRAVRRL